jgi:hypothetical protein
MGDVIDFATRARLRDEREVQHGNGAALHERAADDQEILDAIQLLVSERKYPCSR